jgi:hypothetical protein
LPEGKISAPAVPQAFAAGKIVLYDSPKTFCAGNPPLPDMREMLREGKMSFLNNQKIYKKTNMI